MRRALVIAIAMIIGATALAQKPLPVGDPKKPVITLLGDDADLLIPYLTNDEDVNGRAATADTESVDVFAGATALRVGPQQRFRAQLPGWSFPIREKPKEGEFRYIRFAWKKLGGTSIMLQMHNSENNKTWGQRYFAGKNYFGWEAKNVTETLPAEWTVVTRDLFEDFGAMTLTGLAFTSTDGTGGLFDQIMLGRSVAELDAASDEALGKGKPKEPLAGKARDTAWANFAERDAEKSGPAIREFLMNATEQVTFLREKIAAGDGLTAEQQKALRTKIAELVIQLGDDDFDKRVRAEAELEKIGSAASDELRIAALSSIAEVAFRAKRLTVKLKIGAKDVPPAAILAARVVRILERAANADAKKLLNEMNVGDFGPHYATSAKAALGRLSTK